MLTGMDMASSPPTLQKRHIISVTMKGWVVDTEEVLEEAVLKGFPLSMCF
jgi:hypothetical protein